MVQYCIVRYTKEELYVVDGEALAKSLAITLSNHDYDENAWYEIEPYAVL